jgi:2-hydroxymuconate-semialdehyde hydrolase
MLSATGRGEKIMPLQERDTTFEGIPVHYWEGGQGRPLLLIHGSGPGASTLGNWRLVLEPLAERYHVIAPDLIGFGLSGRKKEKPYFDFDLWFRQSRAMLDLFQESEFAIMGHSISGALALRLAATDPRVKKILTTGCMGARFTPNEHTLRTWTFPETREDLRRAGESLVYDKSLISDAYLDGRMNILHSGDYADYFRSMFAGDKQAYIDAAVLQADEIKSIACDVMMVHGRDDRPFPFEQTTLAISRALPQADVVGLARCGHSPALEHPGKLIELARLIFG